MNPDLVESIREALLGNSGIASQLASYLGSRAIFTRVPAASEAVYPMVVISRNTIAEDEDGVNDYRPRVSYSIQVHGTHEEPSHYRVVSDLGYRIRNLFHVATPNVFADGWDTVRQVCSGPTDQPTTGPTTARAVTLTVLLAKGRDLPDHLLVAGGGGAILTATGGVIMVAG